METELTEFLLKMTFESRERTADPSAPPSTQEQPSSHSSNQILGYIYNTLYSEKNHKLPRNHKKSQSS